MPTKPYSRTLSGNAPQILNAIRNSATTYYKDYVPYASPDSDSIRKIGAIIMDNPNLQNQFLNTLINRIARVIVTSKTYENPWSMFKKGLLEFGETVEEIFVNIAQPFEFDPENSTANWMSREIPDVKSAFHVLNYQKYYKVTISNDQLRQAFLSWDGITDLIARIVNSLYTAANYDEFQTMKYMLAQHILSGQIKVVSIPAVSANNMNQIVSTIKGVSNNLEFLSSDNNQAGVYNYTMKNNQFLILNAKFEAQMNVDVLASAFNMDKAEFAGHQVIVDSFGKLDIDRLNKLFAGDSNYSEIGSSDLQLLDVVPAVLVDRDFFMIFDNFFKFTEQYNGEGLYWNYWFHVWKTFSISPFAPAAMFGTTTPTVTSVTVTPAAVSAAPGSQVTFQAAVQTTGFAPEEVIWSVVSNDEYATISQSGVVTVSADAPNTTVIQIKATSAFDSSKADTANITVTTA